MRIAKKPAAVPPPSTTKTESKPAAASKTKQHAHAAETDGFDHGRTPKTSPAMQMTPTRNLRG